MKSQKIKFFLIAATLIITGCATPQPFERKRYPGPDLPNEQLSTIEIMQEFPELHGTGSVRALNGQALWDETRGLLDPGYIQVLPGKYKIRVRYDRLGGPEGVLAHVWATAEIEATLLPDHGYTINAAEIGEKRVSFILVDKGSKFDPACFLPMFDKKGGYVRKGKVGCKL